MSGKVYGVNPATNEYTAPPRVQDALSALLKGLGFDTMAKDVLDADKAEQRRYARIIAHNFPDTDPARKRQVIQSLRTLCLI